jgi:hypothetical protein
VTKTGDRTDRGGIRTIEDLRIRCHCDEDTGCWNWRGAVNKTGRASAEPRCWLADENKSVLVPRAAWMLGRQAKLQPGDTVWRRCRNDLCCNPQHLLRGDKSAWGEWVARSGYLRGRPERAAINRRNRMAANNIRVTLEIAQWVRESKQTGREVARVIGESEQTVSKIRTGASHVPARAFSVFSWGGV